VKVLYEAMQVGASGNSVIGTIHGASTRAVYERIVNSLGVPAASFRATDAVVVAQNVRISGTMKKKKRVVEIAEVAGGNGKTIRMRMIFSMISWYSMPPRISL
jgi:type IV secretory pathway ATPase VirB11/archaellum biosynthesis ATPase